MKEKGRRKTINVKQIKAMQQVKKNMKRRESRSEMKSNQQTIYKRVLRLAIPMMIQNGITNAVSLVDNIMVGSLGTESITAVSIIGQLIFVFNLAIFGGISGPGIYSAQYYGQGNMEGVRNTFRMKLWICFICMLTGLGVFWFCGDQLIGLYLHGGSTNIDQTLTMQYGLQYLQIMLLGLFPFVITQIYASSLREMEDSVNPMIAGLISVVVDVLFNYLLIYGKFGLPRLGVKGAAIATVLARIVEAAIVVFWSHATAKHKEFFKGLFHRITVPKEIAKGIILKGLPIFANEFLWAGAMAAMTQCYSTRGLEIVAGLNISNTLCNLLNVVFIAMGSAVGIIVGQMLGEGSYEKAKKESFHLACFTGIISAVLMIVLIVASFFFPRLYDVSGGVRRYGTYFIIITAVFFPVQGVLNALYFTIRAGGKTFITFLFDSAFSWCVAFSIALILCVCTDIPILAVYAIVQSVDMIKLFIGSILIKKGIWASNIV